MRATQHVLSYHIAFDMCRCRPDPVQKPLSAHRLASEEYLGQIRPHLQVLERFSRLGIVLISSPEKLFASIARLAKAGVVIFAGRTRQIILDICYALYYIESE
jgi:hypothetical protein